MAASNASENLSSSYGDCDNEQTLIYGTGDDANRISPEELRKLLDIPQGDCIQDYNDLSTIGIGGIGAVFSAREPGLNREVALKILRPQYRDQSERIESFIREARATAQIDHPNIVPVHRLGVFDDVGVYFSMKRVEGETLRAILRKLEENRAGYRRKYNLRRLIEIFMGACNGVAFAHRHGILHCDLKPGNVMVGDYGEVLVMDWGMAHYRPELDQGGVRSKMDLEVGGPLCSGGKHSEELLGGTPAFMAPEQLCGEEIQPTELSDIYGLGAILYTLLTWKSAPFDVNQEQQKLLEAAARGQFIPPRKAAHREQPIPLELEAICLKAMARNRKKRYQHVGELLADVRNYLDGYPVAAYSPTPLYRLTKLIRRHPLIPSTLMAAVLTWGGYYAFTVISNISQSTSLINLAEYNYGQAREYNVMALRTARLLREKAGGGDADRERYLLTELIRQIAEMENGYNSALEFISRAPELGVRAPQVDRMVREIFKSTLELYLQAGNDYQLKNALRQFRGRWRPIFEKAQEQDSTLAQLVGEIDSQNGWLLLLPGSAFGWSVSIAHSDGTPVSEPENASLPLPLSGPVRLQLPAGTYLLKFRQEDGTAFSAPAVVRIARENQLDLELPERIPADMGYIPGGEFQHQVKADDSGMSNVYLPPYLIRKHEVTFREYLEFWNSLTDPVLKKKCLGWFRFDLNSGGSRPIWNEDGVLNPPFAPELPVIGITGEAAMEYCRWLGRKLDRTVRLPTRYEWEKAARGVDGRIYVWGDDYLPGLALLSDHPQADRYPVGAPPGSFPRDVSVFGISDLTGNVREFIRNADDAGPMFQVGGGSRVTGPEQAKCTEFYYLNGSAGDVGFRYVMELPKTAMEKNDRF